MPDPRSEFEGWVLIGMDPGLQPSNPWPGQVTYESREIDVDGATGEFIVYYELAAA